MWDANLASLAARHPEVARRIAEARREGGTVRIVKSASGEPTAVCSGRTFHSQHDPRAEAERQAALAVEESASAIVVSGFGLGYVADAVRRRFPVLPMLVLEPDASMFQTALASRDLTHLLRDERTWFFVAAKPQEIASLLPTLPLAKPVFLPLRPALETNPEWFRIAHEVVQSWLLRREININTLNRFGRLWVRNLARNVRLFAEASGITRLHGLFHGLPALVIAGGPSLDELLPSLAALRERLLIISVNTPLKRCVEAGAPPDFVVVVDPQYWASRFLDWTDPLSAFATAPVIVAEPSTHPRLLRRRSSCYLCSSLFPLGEALEEAVGEKGKLGAGGSVSTAAWDLARHLGASPIYMAGLDLGYPGMRTHCKGVFTEDLWLTLSDRLLPLETRSFSSLREIGLFPMLSACGGLTQTDRRMLLYKWWFENQLTIHPEARTFTLSPDGVAVSGMALAQLSDLSSLPPVRKEIDARLAKERQTASELTEPPKKTRTLRAKLRELVGGLQELQGLSGRALKANEDLGSSLASGGQGSVPLVSELDEIDNRILSVSQRGIVGFLMQSLIHQIGGRGEEKASTQQTLTDGEALYRGIMESARWQEEVISKALSELEARFS
jgi:hypothetical protein